MPNDKETAQSRPENTINMFAEYSTRNLKEIYFRSESIKPVAALIVVSSITLALEGFMISKYWGKDIFISSVTKPLNILIIFVNALSLIGLITRATWGRIVGLLTCALWIASPLWLSRFSIFVLFGIWGLFVLIPGDNLFGPGRILSKELKVELKRRKENSNA